MPPPVKSEAPPSPRHRHRHCPHHSHHPQDPYVSSTAWPGLEGLRIDSLPVLWRVWKRDRSWAQGHLVSEQVPNRQLRSATLRGLPVEPWVWHRQKLRQAGQKRIQRLVLRYLTAPSPCAHLSSPCLCRDPTFPLFIPVPASQQGEWW